MPGMRDLPVYRVLKNRASCISSLLVQLLHYLWKRRTFVVTFILFAIGLFFAWQVFHRFGETSAVSVLIVLPILGLIFSIIDDLRATEKKITWRSLLVAAFATTALGYALLTTEQPCLPSLLSWGAPAAENEFLVVIAHFPQSGDPDMTEIAVSWKNRVEEWREDIKALGFSRQIRVIELEFLIENEEQESRISDSCHPTLIIRGSAESNVRLKSSFRITPNISLPLEQDVLSIGKLYLTSTHSFEVQTLAQEAFVQYVVNKPEELEYVTYFASALLAYFDAELDSDVTLEIINQAIERFKHLPQTSKMAGEKLYVLRALLQMRRGQYHETVADCDQAIALSQQQDIAFNTRGIAHLYLHAYEAAIIDFTQAINIADTITQYTEYQAIYYANRAVAYSASGEDEKAIADFDSSIRLDSDNPVIFNERGIYYSYREDYSQAEDEFTRCISFVNSDPACYANRAIVRAELGNYDDAFTDCHQALELDDERAGFYYSCGIVHYRQATTGSVQLFTDAVGYFTKAIELDGTVAEFFNARGQAYAENGNYSEAIENFSQAIDLISGLGYYLNRAKAYGLAEEYELALEDLLYIAARQPDEPVVHMILGDLYYQLDKYDEAIERYQQVVNIRPDASQAHWQMGQISFILRRYNDARIYFQSYLNLGGSDQFIDLEALIKQLEIWARRDGSMPITYTPPTAEAYFHIGQQYEILYLYIPALNKYQQATTLDPNYADAYLSMARIYDASHCMGDAERSYGQYIALNPPNGMLEFARKKQASLEQLKDWWYGDWDSCPLTDEQDELKLYYPGIL